MSEKPINNSAFNGPLAGGWLVVACLWFVAALNYLDRSMINTMRESLTEAVPMREKEFGLLTSVFLWIYGGFSPIAGFLADKFSRSRVIVASIFIWSAVTWLTSQASTYHELLLARALMGLSEACYIPAAMALIADYHRGSTRSLATGIHLSGISIGSSLGCLGGVLAESHSWQFPFQLFGIGGVLYSVFLMAVLRNPPAQAIPEPSSPQSRKTGSTSVGFLDACRHLFTNGQFLIVVVAWSLLGFSGWAMNAWMPTYIKEEFYLGEGLAGALATVSQYVPSFTGAILGGFLADRWTRTNPRGRILIPVIGAAIAAPGVLMASTVPILPMAVAGLITYGLTRQFVDSNMMPVLCLISDSRYRATGYGIMNFFSCLVGGIASLIGGQVRDAGSDVSIVFQAAAVGVFIAAILLSRIRLTQPAMPTGQLAR